MGLGIELRMAKFSYGGLSRKGQLRQPTVRSALDNVAAEERLRIVIEAHLKVLIY
jgi:hypothetical protein